jgi:catechol 2,3-dioxygenase-like lactoylglutathione lyase family enzyme
VSPAVALTAVKRALDPQAMLHSGLLMDERDMPWDRAATMSSATPTRQYDRRQSFPEGRERMPGEITHLIAGVPVSDLDTSIDWYTRFFGRPPDMRAGDEILWDIDEHATLFIEPSTQAGAGRVTFAVTGLDAFLDRFAAQRIVYEPVETYDNGVRHVNVPDPDGNMLALAEPPDSSQA